MGKNEFIATVGQLWKLAESLPAEQRDPILDCIQELTEA